MGVLGWVLVLASWVGLGEEKWTHVHLWDIQTDRHQNWQTRQLMAITLRASAYTFVNDAQSWPNSKTINKSLNLPKHFCWTYDWIRFAWS